MKYEQIQTFFFLLRSHSPRPTLKFILDEKFMSTVEGVAVASVLERYTDSVYD